MYHINSKQNIANVYLWLDIVYYYYNTLKPIQRITYAHHSDPLQFQKHKDCDKYTSLMSFMVRTKKLNTMNVIHTSDTYII